jgi:inorganic pyrophosphatase
MALITTGLLFLTYLFRENHDAQLAKLMSNFSLAFFSGLSFLLGALFSAASGYAGIWVSVRANVRVAAASRSCYH